MHFKAYVNILGDLCKIKSEKSYINIKIIVNANGNV